MKSSASSPVGLLASGGLDSCILMGHLLQQGRRVQPFYVKSGLHWEAAEMLALRHFCEAIGMLDALVVLDLPLADLYQNHWSLHDERTPDASTPDDAVFLPGRDPLLLIKPAIWCQLHGIENLALAVLASNPFPDATPAFFEAYQRALGLAGCASLAIERPFACLRKVDVMRLGRGMPLELTFSCLAPVVGRHCGRCNKCAERQAAFRAAEMTDPTRYAAAEWTSLR
jgi:7-cyano-7-deazaguanine synthase